MEDQLIYAYLAGAIDADGHISVQRTRKNVKKNKKRPSIYYTPKVGLSGTHAEVPLLLSSLFGGKVYEHQPQNPNHKKWYVWSASNKRAAIVLRQILPYLRIKQEQAKLAIELHEVMRHDWEEIKATQKPPYQLTEEMNARRYEYWAQVTQLNEPRNRRVHFVDVP